MKDSYEHFNKVNKSLNVQNKMQNAETTLPPLDSTVNKSYNLKVYQNTMDFLACNNCIFKSPP